jgi:hypothetical protein
MSSSRGLNAGTLCWREEETLSTIWGVEKCRYIKSAADSGTKIPEVPPDRLVKRVECASKACFYLKLLAVVQLLLLTASNELAPLLFF